MKKILLFMSAATMFAAISCNKVEVNSPQTQTPSVNHTHESIEFVAYTEVETKTTLNDYATEWEEGDEIDINEVVYRAQESGNKSVFTIVDPEAEVPEAPYHAGYPSTCVYDNNENIEGKLAFNFSNEHILNEGEICEDVLAVAYSESEPSLYFKNVVSLLKFQAPEFTEDITEIRISTSEPLAGHVYVDYINATWTPDESEETFNEVILTANSGKFEPGKTYYVPVFPGGKTNLTVYINGTQAATVKEFECKRNVIHNIGTLPTPAPAPEPVYYNVYVCISDLGWTAVNMHQFTSAGDITPWPGEVLTETVTIAGRTYYKKAIEEGTTLSFTYNNGKASTNFKIDVNEVTVNEDIYYRLSARGAIEVDPNDEKTFGYAIYVFDQKSKNFAPNLYTWNDNSAWNTQYGGNFGSWPGVAFESDCYYIPADGQNWKHYYYYEIPTALYGKSFKFIVNKKGQTSDLSVTKLAGDLYVGYWYDSSSSNGFWTNSNLNTPITQ